MPKKIFSGFLIFFMMLFFVQKANAEEDSFSARATGMSEIKNLRYNSGSGRIRIVLDVTKKIEYEINFLENPSRIVIDINNSWLSKNVPREVELNSTAASKIRMAQFDKSKVRLVIETSAENNTFYLPGGEFGGRLVIDIGADAEKPGFDEKVKDDSGEITVDKPFQNEPIETEPTDITKVPDGVPNLNSKEKSNEDKKAKKEAEKKEKEEKKEREKREKEEKKEREKKEREEKKNKDDKNLKEIDKKLNEMTTLEGKKIAIDAGHGGNDPGAIGPSGVMEKTVTLKVALELEKLLEAEGAEVIMTRRTDIEVAERGRKATDIEELKSRCDIANEAKVDIFVSIHADSFTNPASRGTTGYYYSKGSANSRKLADCIRSALIEQIKTPSRGTQPCNFYVVRNTDMPATLIELGFISNPIEEALMNSKEGVQKAAQGIFDGIEDYFG